MIRDHSTTEFVYTRPQSSPDFLLQCLNEFRQEDNFTDVTVHTGRVGSTGLRCHRVVLAVHSPYFKAVFRHQSEFAPRPIILPDLPADAVEALINFMYTGSLPITSSNVIDIMETAEFLQFRDVVEVCAMLLLEQVDHESSLKLEHLGASHLCRGLVEAAKRHSLLNFNINHSTLVGDLIPHY